MSPTWLRADRVQVAFRISPVAGAISQGRVAIVSPACYNGGKEDTNMPAKAAAAKTADGDRPEVIVDFIFDDGLLFITVKNISDQPAYRVSTSFDPPLCGVEGKKIWEMELFRNIEFLAPRKEIMTFFDTAASFFRREGPTMITVNLSYRDTAGRKYSATIRHDLAIYRDIGYVRRPDRRGTPPDI